MLGVKNVRLLHERDCDTAPLTEDDFREPEIPPQYHHILKIKPTLHKLYMIENCKLAGIGNEEDRSHASDKADCFDSGQIYFGSSTAGPPVSTPLWQGF